MECPNYNWVKDVTDYSQKKHHYVGTSFSPTKRATYKDFKNNECFFNPLTQKYTNKDYNNQVNSAEKALLPKKISSHYDRNLRYEQTFDIINLKDKLKIFKNHSQYPKVKEPIFNLKDPSKIEYNILSNVNLTKHHFDKPENRPDKPSTVPLIRPPKRQTWTYKDYDVISNKYNENHDQKYILNDNIHKLEAANKYWKTHNFNPVLGSFYDPKKENKFQDDRIKKASVWGKELVYKLPKKVQDEGLLYNPVNQKVLDEDRLNKYISKEKAIKKRYERKNDIEEFYLCRDLAITDRNEKRQTNKKCYEYYREVDNRGYDIVNFDKTYNKYKDNMSLKDHKNEWELLKEKSSEKNNNFKSKKTFRDNFDYSDANNNLYDFKNKRESKRFLNILIFI